MGYKLLLLAAHLDICEIFVGGGVGGWSFSGTEIVYTFI